MQVSGTVVYVFRYVNQEMVQSVLKGLPCNYCGCFVVLECYFNVLNTSDIGHKNIIILLTVNLCVLFNLKHIISFRYTCTTCRSHSWAHLICLSSIHWPECNSAKGDKSQFQCWQPSLSLTLQLLPHPCMHSPQLNTTVWYPFSGGCWKAFWEM